MNARTTRIGQTRAASRVEQVPGPVATYIRSREPASDSAPVDPRRNVGPAADRHARRRSTSPGPATRLEAITVGVADEAATVQATPPPPPSSSTTLFQRADAEFSILRHDDGRVTLSQDLKLRRLVFSGGGAKGVVYPGAIKALEASGQMEHITEVAGASVGAIAAAFVAAGMNAYECKTLLDNLNLPLLFSRKESPDEALTEPSELGPVRSQLAIAGNLSSRAPNLKKFVAKAIRDAALRRLEALGPTDITDIEDIRSKLSNGGDLVFGDLLKLSEHVPGIKKMYCTGTALCSGPGFDGVVPQLTVFSTDDDAFADMEIAEAVVISSTLPYIFKKRQIAMAHDLTDDPKARTRFIDGGLTLNTPAWQLIDPDAPPSEDLIIGLEHPLITQARDGKDAARRPLLAKIIDVVGVKTNANNQQFRGSFKFVAAELLSGPMARQTVEARLKGVVGEADYSGSKGTLALAMTQAEKDGMVADLQAQVLQHLSQRSGDRTYSSLDHLMFALTPDQAKVLEANADNGPEISSALGRQQALQHSLLELKTTIRQWPESHSRAAMLTDIGSWMKRIDSTLEGDAVHGAMRRDAIAEALAADRDLTVRHMVDLIDEAAPGPAGLQASILQKHVARACHRISQRIRWSFLYPIRERMAQIGLNDDILVEADAALASASVRADINVALKHLEQRYRVIGFTSLKSLSPVIRKLRSYYLREAPRPAAT